MDKKQLLKQLLPGLAPLIVFVIADEIWGPKVGLAVAIGVGVIELIVSFLQKRKPDKFMMIDLGLIIAMGVVSIALNNDVFFKLKPVLMGLVMIALMGFMAYLPDTMLRGMQLRYMPSVAINPFQQYEFVQSLKRLIWIMTGHTLITTATVFYASSMVWGLVSGPGFFVVAGLWLALEFFIKKRNHKAYINEEWLPLVDTEGKITGQAPRSVVHAGSMLLHPVVHLHVVNKNGIYLQKRPAFKQVQPNKWDTAVGGHVGVNEPIDKALAREAYEEIGLDTFNAQLLTQYVWKCKVEHELVFSFITHDNKPLTPNLSEVDEGKYWSFSEIDEQLGKNVFTPNFEKEYRDFLVQLKPRE
jgi:isopentenyldiphosphate isomerase